MKILRIVAALVLLGGLACDTPEPDVVAPDGPQAARATAATDRALVEFNGPAAAVTAAVEAAGGRIGRIHEAIGVLEVYGLDAAVVSEIAGVTDATPDRARPLIQSYPIEYPVDGSYPTVVLYELDPASSPNFDPGEAYFRDCQWNLDHIQADVAWAAGARGAGVKVALLDTGVDPDHIDLVGRIDLVQSTSMLTYEGEGCPSEDRSTFIDFNMHGTSTTGFVTTNNIGTAGVAPDAEVVMVKVAACDGWGLFGDFLAGFLYAAELEDVEVISISLVDMFKRGTPGSKQFIAMAQKAMNYATRQGKLVVGTAGNWSMNLDRMADYVLLPSSLANVKTAYATDHLDQLAWYSDYGVHDTWVGAPGGDYGNYDGPALPGCPAMLAAQSRLPLLCTGHSVWPPASEICGGKTSVYGYSGAGTSYATPTVAGVAALIEGTRHGAYNPHQVAAILAQTADDLGEPGVDSFYSHGRVNAGRAVQRK